MTLDQLFEMWQEDCKIDRTELAEEALKISSLHTKYHTLYTKERLRLKKLEADYKVLKLEKYEFYTQGPTKETQEKGWELPAKGLILKGDIPMYMEADSELIEQSLKIGYQQEKVDLLESILKSLVNRGYNIKTAVDWNRLMAGG